MTRAFLAGLMGLALLMTPAAGRAAVEQPVKTRIDSGVLVGRSDGVVTSFKGVPFAAPPVADLRWAPPQPARPWAGELDAGQFGRACMQPMRPDGRINGGGYSGPVSEDCLNLNIYAPKGAKHAPVMVWIYGGANVYGANSVASYDGEAFARDGVVLVEVNYRLGALGFFAHPSLTKAAKPGELLANYGLMDQIAALAWVKRNIAAFGGDPGNVTVFGESAGGIDILALMSAPSTKGLYSKAIVESGGGWRPAANMAGAESRGLSLARKAGALDSATPAELRTLPAETLVVSADNGVGAGPVVDGKLIPIQPDQAFAGGQTVHVPLIIGSNSYEASLMCAFSIEPARFLALFPPEVKAAYDGEAKSDDALASALFTDAVMGGPARWIAGRNAAASPTWLYYFSYVRVAQRSNLPGANHASEIPYVFASQDTIPVYSKEIVPEDRALAALMHACWVAFAKGDSPKCPGQAWPAYSPAKDQLLEFGQSVGVREHFRKTQLDQLERLELGRLAKPSAP